MEWLEREIHVKEGTYTAKYLLDLIYKSRGPAKTAKKKVPARKVLIKEPDSDAAPGIKVVIDTLNWINGSVARHEKVMESLVSKTGKLKGNARTFISTCLSLNVPVAVDFIFNRMADDGFLKPADLRLALESDAASLREAMDVWGLNQVGVKKGSKAAKAVAGDREMKAAIRQLEKESTDKMIADSNHVPGQAKSKIDGSAAQVMAALKGAHDSLKPETLDKLVTHMRDNESDPQVAVKPIIKLFNKNDDWKPCAELVDKLADRVPVDSWASAFRGNWEPVYSSLCQSMAKKGKFPPWLAKA